MRFFLILCLAGFMAHGPYSDAAGRTAEQATMPSASATDAASKPIASLRLEGRLGEFASNRKAAIGNLKSPKTLTGWAIEMWLRYSEFETYSCGTDGCTGEALNCNKAGAVASLLNGAISVVLDGTRNRLVVSVNGKQQADPILFKPESWHHVVIEKCAESAEGMIYYDGQGVQKTPLPAPAPGATRSGASAGGIGNLDGAIRGLAMRDVAIYDRCLGPSRVSSRAKTLAASLR